MDRVLIVYSTVEGQTRKIAKVIHAELRRSGVEVSSFDVNGIHLRLRVSDYDFVLIGSSVHASGYPRSLRAWIRNHASLLGSVPGAFFSVCLGILEKNNERTQAKERKLVRQLFDETGWNPDTWTIFAGALRYSQYGWLKRRIMKWISARAGGDIDTTGDYEYTDWNAVKTFAQEIRDQMAGRSRSRLTA